MNCCLCENLSRRNDVPLWDRPLVESANFAILPSLGSLVEGWLLIVPKTHYLCMGALPAGLVGEMQDVKAEISSHLLAKYGSVCAFEHGPSAPTRSVGCGVDHAHTHLVPLDFALLPAAAPFLPPATSWKPAGWEECRTAYEEGCDYLYVEQPLGKGLISVHQSFGSQVLRKTIAAHLGVPDQFNWREYPKVDVIARTAREWAGMLHFACQSDPATAALK